MVLIVLCFDVGFCSVCTYVRHKIIYKIKLNFSSLRVSGHLLGIAAHSAYDMFSLYMYLILVNLIFSHLGFYSGTFFLIVPF